MFEAFEIVRSRQEQIVRAIDEFELLYALSGSNATFVWISSVDESAVRAYRNVELIIRRQDNKLIAKVLAEIGLEAEIKADYVLFRNQFVRRDHWSDRALFANEIPRGKSYRVPDVESAEVIDGVRNLSLSTLVEFQLERWTLDDKVDLRDMMDAGLVDATWPTRYSPELAARLQHLLDTPDG